MANDGLKYLPSGFELNPGQAIGGDVQTAVRRLPSGFEVDPVEFQPVDLGNFGRPDPTQAQPLSEYEQSVLAEMQAVQAPSEERPGFDERQLFAPTAIPTPAALPTPVNTGGVGGDYAFANRFHEMPFKLRQQRTKQLIKGLQTTNQITDPVAKLQIAEGVQQQVDAYMAENQQSLRARVLPLWQQFMAQEDYVNQTPERQKLLDDLFKQRELAVLKTQYPPEQGRGIGAEFKIMQADAAKAAQAERQAVVRRERERLLARTEEPGFFEKVFNFYAPDTDFERSIVGGLTRAFSSIPRVIGQITEGLSGGPGTFSQKTQEFADWMDAQIPPLEDSSPDDISNVIGQGIGFVGSMFLGGGVGGLAAKGAAKAAAIFGVGTKTAARISSGLAKLAPVKDGSKVANFFRAAALQTVRSPIPLLMAGSAETSNILTEYYREAEKRGEKVEPWRVAIGMGAGALISLPDILFGAFPRLLPSGSRMAKVLDDFVTKYGKNNPNIVQTLKRASLEGTRGALAEGTQEAVQNAMSEAAIAFIAERDVNYAEALRQMALEGTAGGVIGGAIGLIAGRRIPRIPGADQNRVDEIKEEISVGATIQAELDRVAGENPDMTTAQLLSTVSQNLNVPIGQVQQILTQGPAAAPEAAQPTVAPLSAEARRRVVEEGATPEQAGQEVREEAPFYEAGAATEGVVLTPEQRADIADTETAYQAGVEEGEAEVRQQAQTTENQLAQERGEQTASSRTRERISQWLTKWFAPGGLTADTDAIWTWLRAGKSPVSGVADVLQGRLSATTASGFDIMNRLALVQEAAKEAGVLKLDKLPQDQRAAFDRAIKGDMAVIDTLPQKVQDIVAPLATYLHSLRTRVVNEFVAPRLADLRSRINPELLPFVEEIIPAMRPGAQIRPGEGFFEGSLVEQIKARALNETLKQAEQLPEAQRNDFIKAETQRITGLISDQSQLLKTADNFNDLARTIYDRAAWNPETEESAYLHRAYKMFSDKAFRRARKKDTKRREEMAAFLANDIRQLALKNQPGLPDKSKQQVQRGETDAAYQARLLAMGRSVVDEWVEGKALSDYGLTSAPGVVTALLRRKNLAPEIREFLGEITDPVTVAAMTAHQLNMLLANTKFASDLRTIMGEQELISEVQPGTGRWRQLDMSNRQGFDLVDGMWTPEDLHAGISDFLATAKPPNWVKALDTANYWAKWDLTVASPATTARNYAFNIFNGIKNGTLSPTEYISALRELAPQVLKSTKAFGEQYMQAVRSGAAAETLAAGHLQKMSDAFVASEDLETALRGAGALTSRVADKVKRGTDVMRDIYVFGDDLGKFVAFMVEKKRRTKARMNEPQFAGMSEEEVFNSPEIIEEAAKIVKRTWTSYRLLPKAIQTLRRGPLSAFPSFSFEMLRTSYMGLRQIQEDIQSDNPAIKALGVRRAMGNIAAYATTPLLIQAVQRMIGMSDEEKEHACQTSIDTRYEDCWTQLFLYRTPNGYAKLDMKWLDPSTYVMHPIFNPLSELLRDKNVDLAPLMVDSFRAVLEPFYSPDIIWDRMAEVLKNEQNAIYNEEADSEGEILTKIAKYMGGTWVPKFVKIGGEFVESARGTRTWRGAETPDEVAVRNLGVRKMVAPDKAKYDARAYMRLRKAWGTKLNRFMKGEVGLNPTEDVRGLLLLQERANEELQAAWTEMIKTKDSLRLMPQRFSDALIRNKLAKTGDGPLSKKNVSAVMAGAPAPRIGITKGSIDSYIKKVRSNLRLTKAEADDIALQLRALQELAAP